MKNKIGYREEILNNSAYWVEGINGLLYDAIVTYMEKHDMKQKDLAKHLGVSTGRVSQILNDGEINFSLDKIVEIALKVDKFPNFLFEEKATFLERERQKNTFNKYFVIYNNNDISKELNTIISHSSKSLGSKVIQINQKQGAQGCYNVTNQLAFSNG